MTPQSALAQVDAKKELSIAILRHKQSVNRNERTSSLEKRKKLSRYN